MFQLQDIIKKYLGRSFEQNYKLDLSSRHIKSKPYNCFVEYEPNVLCSQNEIHFMGLLLLKEVRRTL